MRRKRIRSDTSSTARRVAAATAVARVWSAVRVARRPHTRTRVAAWLSPTSSKQASCARETIEYRRAREGRVFPANLTSDGRVQLEDGRIFDSLSRAACELAKIAALPGWEVWTAPERGGRRLMDIRNDFLASLAEPVDPA
jgi:hypothetical protein